VQKDCAAKLLNGHLKGKNGDFLLGIIWQILAPFFKKYLVFWI